MKEMISRTKIVLFLVTVAILTSATGSFAMMGWGGWSGGCGWSTGGGGMMTNAGGFGMMNGMPGGPVVDPDGTAYIVSMAPSSAPGTSPTWKSFQSHLLAVPPSGELLDLTMDGLMSRPVINGNTLISTTSLPYMGHYWITANYGTTTKKSVLFFLQLPLSTSSVPTAVQMDGRFASAPVIANGQIYVTTSNFGYGMMMGNDVFNNTFPNYAVSNTANAYLYVFDMDGTLVSKTVLQ